MPIENKFNFFLWHAPLDLQKFDNFFFFENKNEQLKKKF